MGHITFTGTPLAMTTCVEEKLCYRRASMITTLVSEKWGVIWSRTTPCSSTTTPCNCLRVQTRCAMWGGFIAHYDGTVFSLQTAIASPWAQITSNSIDSKMVSYVSTVFQEKQVSKCFLLHMLVLLYWWNISELYWCFIAVPFPMWYF